MSGSLDLIIDGIDFGEGMRWHDGRLWYSDFHQHSISSVGPDGDREVAHSGLDDRPSGLGWLPDGSLLAVSMVRQRVWREVDGALVEHADLSGVATGHCNDMVVDHAGRAYVGSFGFDLEAGDRFAPAHLARVDPDGSVSLAADLLAFPNGMVITPDERTLVVGETFGGGYQAFTIADDGSLGDRRTWAETPGMAPDGCALDAEGGIWFADALGSQLVRVLEGGEITHRMPTPMPTYACMLGGPEGTTLYAMCAPDARPEVVAGQAAGALFATDVTVPHAGRP